MPKDKAGNQLTWKEYMKKWRDGIEGITPLQQANIQIRGTYIIILGLCCGIFITMLNIKDLWWLSLILVGGLFNSAMQWVGLYQKKKVLERLYNLDRPTFEEGFDEPEEVNVTGERKGMGDVFDLIETDAKKIIEPPFTPLEEDFEKKLKIITKEEVDLI